MVCATSRLGDDFSPERCGCAERLDRRNPLPLPLPLPLLLLLLLLWLVILLLLLNLRAIKPAEYRSSIGAKRRACLSEAS